MLRATITLLLCSVALTAAAGPLEVAPLSSFSPANSIEDIIVHEVGAKLSLCNPCIQFAEQGINVLLNEILNAGVIGGCSKLCGYINGTAAKTACTLVCDVVGVKGFIKALNSTDIDPIYLCEKLTVCPMGGPDASASIAGVVATPATGPQGTKFSLELDFAVANATGVSEIRLSVKGPVTTSVSQSFVQMGWAPGNFNAKIGVDTTTVEPSGQDAGVTWNPGSYEYTFELCQGECGSKHPGSIVFGTKTGTFTIGNSYSLI